MHRVTDDRDANDDLTSRVARLEEIVARLTSADESPAPTDGAATAGVVGYRGAVDLAGDVSWDIAYGAQNVLGLSPDALVDVFAALGHPARLAIVRILLRGNASVTDLQDAGEFGTSGQLYHHLKILTGAAVVTKLGRNEYGIAATHVVPTLIAMLAAGDIAGTL